eukprot:scaffold102817_cov63-Phaeocystis_antarctica.AAC.1
MSGLSTTTEVTNQMHSSVSPSRTSGPHASCRRHLEPPARCETTELVRMRTRRRCCQLEKLGGEFSQIRL